MVQPGNTCKIHQVLHGYSDGHRLLEASGHYTSDVRSTMLVLSDMSGPNLIEGFETYVTGYPLSKLKCYALARTWYAHEMNRPGCVWTHTLLINFSDLGQLDNLAILDTLFKRPSGPAPQLGPYALPIELYVADHRNTGAWMPGSNNTDEKLIDLLYGSPGSPVFLAADDSKQYESLILQVWSQQWPRLRREFSFCTGSMADRSSSILEFDLQVIPKEIRRNIERTVPKASILSSADDKTDIFPDSSWISLSTRDLRENPQPTSQTSTPPVFLSYFRDNFEEARILRQYLQGQGFSVWWDQMILPGEDWRFEIRKAMKQSGAVVLCLSKEAVARKTSEIYPEIFEAVKIYREHQPGKAWLLPVRFSDCTIPPIRISGPMTLGDLQFVDLFPAAKRETGMKLLAASLRDALQPPKSSVDTPGTIAEEHETEIEIIVDRDISRDEFVRLIHVLVEFLEMGNLRLLESLSVSLQSGRGMLTLRLPAVYAERLFWAIKAGKFEENNVIDARLKESYSPVSNLRKFLWSYGPDIHHGRAAFKLLIESYILVEKIHAGNPLLSDLTETIARAYPKPEDALLLKTAIYGAHQNNRVFLPKLPEVELLLELMTTEYSSAFDAEELRVHDRVQLILDNSDSPQARQLISGILTANLNRLGEKVFLTVLDGVGIEDLIKLTKNREEVLYRILKNNLDLATSQKLWEQAPTVQVKCVRALAKKVNPKDETWDAIIGAMLDAGSQVAAVEVGKHVGENAVRGILNWLDRGHDSLSARWKEVLDSNPIAVVSWLEQANDPKVEIIVLITDMLKPHDRDLQAKGTHPWLPVAAKARGLRGNRRVRVMSFLLAFAFNNPQGKPSRIVAESFQVVHDAAEKEKLPGAAWRLLERQVAISDWSWRDWDKCEKLRRALVGRFIRYNWPLRDFLAAVERKDTLKRVVRYCKTFYQGRYFLKHLVNGIEKGELRPTKSQLETIEKHL